MLNVFYLIYPYVASTVSVRTLTKKLMKQTFGSFFFFLAFISDKIISELVETKYITSVLVSLFFIYDFSALCLASFILSFSDEDNYKKIRSEIYNNRDKIIVIAGKWESSDEYNKFISVIPIIN